VLENLTSQSEIIGNFLGFDGTFGILTIFDGF